MKNSSVTILATLLFTTNLALAEDLPEIKEGMWENVIVENGNTTKSKQCFGSSQSIKDFFESRKKMISGMCSEIKLTRSGSKFSSTLDCDMGITKINVVSEASGDFTSQYKFSSKSVMTPPLMGNAVSTTSGTATYIGPCEAGMKSGDIIMADGKKINFEDMAEQTKGMANMPNMKEVMKKMQQEMMKK